jgi:murein DD-endopeptidase MepM/ murein hydrolase activator NlpD
VGSRSITRLLLVAALVPLAPATAAAAGDPDVAALQVALRSSKLYRGPVDGRLGPPTSAAISDFQRRSGLPVDGLPGPTVRAALGEYGRWTLGSRLLSARARGWDVAGLQFLLAWQGFPSGPINGAFTERTAAAVRRFQRWAGIAGDGVAGPETLRRLHVRPPRSPLRLSPPLRFPVAGLFGPRGDRFHTGLDFGAPAGAPVAVARPGRVTYAGWHPGGWGNLVSVAHGAGVLTMYAHLSRITVRVGQRVEARAVVGAVGSSGNSSGPHLHFEVQLRGAAVDPVSALAGNLGSGARGRPLRRRRWSLFGSPASEGLSATDTAQAGASGPSHIVVRERCPEP